MEANLVRAALSTALAPVAWGTTYWVTRQWLPPDLPLTGSAIRALPAGLLVLAVTRTLPRGSWWWRSAVISVLTVGGLFVLLYVAGTRLPSGVAATLMASSSLAMLVVARILLGERASRRSYAGAFVGLAGVGLLIGGDDARLDAVGIGASILAVVSSSIGFALAKRWSPPVGPLPFTGWLLTWAGVMLTPLALVVEGPPRGFSAPELGGFAYAALVATALAYVCWFYGLARLPAGTVGIIGLLNPLAGAMLGVLVAGETMTMPQALGALSIAAGVAAALPRSRPDSPTRPGSPPRTRSHRHVGRLSNPAAPTQHTLVKSA